MAQRFSCSKIKTFHTCKLRYYLQYVKKYDSTDTSKAPVTEKGLAFHETAEQYYTGIPEDVAYKILEDKIKEHNVNTDVDNGGYPMYKAFNRFKLIWKLFIEEREKEGYVVKKEEEFGGVIDDHPFQGFLDLFLDAGDKIIILDYKSPKTIAASQYKEQLILYAYLVGLQRGWTEEQIIERTKLYVIFPFGDHKKEGLTDEEDALECIKQLRFKLDTLRDVIADFYIKSMREIELMDWTPITGRSGTFNPWTCDFCPYKGAMADESNGFIGCYSSRDQEVYQKRGVKFVLRESKSDSNSNEEKPSLTK